MNRESVLDDFDGSSYSGSDASSDASDGGPEEEEFGDSAPEADYVALVSKEGRRFVLAREVAQVSEVLAAALGQRVAYNEALSNEVHLRQFRADVVEKLVDYLHLAHNFRDRPKQMPKISINNDMVMELLVAADFLRV